MSCIFDCFSKCVLLSKQKEDEVTWSKIDNTFIKLKDELLLKEDCNKFMDQFSDLLLRSILSERSKLSGTSILLLKKICNILQNEIKNVNSIVSALLKLSGRSNKIVYTRAHDALEYLSQFIDVSQYYKLLLESFESTNKNVRLGVIKIIKNNKACNFKLQKLIEKGKTDTFIEIRNICKSYKIEIQKEMPISKIPILPLKIPIESPFVQHSPFKKILKTEKKEDSSGFNKILELEKQVNKITNYKKIEKKTKPIIFKPQIVKKEIQDDLTPKKLDKYLSKYRNIYGNILEEKGNDIIEINNEENNVLEINSSLCDLSKEIENISLVEECNGEALTYEYTIMNSDKTRIDEEPKNEKNKMENEKNEFENEDIKNEDKKIELEHEDKKNELEHEDRKSKLEHEDKKSKLEHEEVKIEDEDGKIELEHEDKKSKLEHEEVKIEDEDGKIELEHEDKKIEDKKNESKIEEVKIEDKKNESKIEEVNNKVFSPCTKNNQNRFSSLLFADKEECVIYDINAESPLFKTLNHKNTNTEISNNYSSSISKSVINTAVSSSFLYSNDDNSIDYTKIDSVIFVDKNLFKSKKK